MVPAAGNINSAGTWMRPITAGINIPAANPIPFAAYPYSTFIGWGRPYINRFRRLVINVITGAGGYE
jgi:hypothetical protein